MRKLTKQEFINKSNKVHNYKYNYNEVDYINTTTKICITCKIHGEFLQKPSKHLSGQGCKLCGHFSTKQKQSLTKDEVILKFKKIHKDRDNCQ